MTRFVRLLPYIRRQRGWLLVIVAVGLLAAAVTAAEPWPLKLLADVALGDAAAPSWLATALDTVGLGAEPMTLIIAAAAATVAVFTTLALLEAALSWMWTRVGQAMMYDLAADMVAHLLRQNVAHHRRHEVGDRLSRITGDIWCVFGFVQGVLIAPLQHAATAVFIAVLAWRLDPLLTLVLLGVAPLLALAARYFGPRLKQRAREGQEARARLTSFIQQTLIAIPVVQAFHTAAGNRKQFDRLADDATTATQAGVFYRGAYRSLTGTLTTVGFAAVLIVGGARVIDGRLSLGSLLVFLAYVRSLQASSAWLLAVWSQAKTAEASLDRVLDVLDADEHLHEADDATPLPGHAPDSGGVAVALDRVTFGYLDGRPVLKNVTLHAPAGALVAIVGPTGSGKSTLAALVPRLFDPWEGGVSIAGRDVRSLTLDACRDAVAVVPQEPLLLPGTLAENIAYARPDAARRDIERAARAAGMGAWLDTLPGGLDTAVGERGVTLSGGQRQRVAIARAILKDAPVVVLDEPTAALDAETEARVMSAITGGLGPRTTIVIAHRLSTIRDADTVYVLEGGEVVEYGPPGELLARPDGAFRDLWERQHRVAESSGRAGRGRVKTGAAT